MPQNVGYASGWFRYREPDSSSICNLLNIMRVQCISASEHGHLQRWTVSPEMGQLVSGHRLNDEMDMNGRSASVGPEAVVDLLRLDQLSGYLRCTAQQRPQLCGFGRGEVSHGRDVSLGLHNQSPKPKRSNAVLDEPEVRSVDQTAGEWVKPRRKIASQTPLHARSLS